MAAPLSWVESFLSNRTQQVLVNGKSSKCSPVTSGVPQGTVLGPLLFLVYINDLPECVQSQTRLFADDSLLYREINTPDDVIALQHDLNQLQIWEATWLMKFNTDKCELLHITNKRKPFLGTYSVHGQ